MKKQAEESKHDKFVRLAEVRTNKIIDTLQLLGNCSNTSVYEYTQDEVEEISRQSNKNCEKRRRNSQKQNLKKQPDSR